MSGPGHGGPRVPTLVLVGFVALCLGGAAWLFLAGDDDEPAPRDEAVTSQETDERDLAEGELSLPDDRDAPTDERRRDERGIDRLDPDDVGAGRGEQEPSSDAARRLPTVLSNVRGRTVALLAASAAGPGDGRVRVAGVRVACAASADAGRADAEQALLDELAGVLEQAGAEVVRADAPAACVDVRATRANAADLAIVARAGTGDATVRTGLAPTRGGEGSAASRALAGELAAALDLTAVTPARSGDDRTALAQLGAVDLQGGGAMAVVELDLRELDSSGLEQLALELAEAIGTAASRTDVS